MSFVYKADPARGRVWADVFAREAPEMAFRVWPDVGDASQVRFLAAWEPPPKLAEHFPHLELLFSTGAGVDQFDLAALPPDLPIVRMIEPGIVNGMVEYVCWAVLGLHRDMPQYQRQQAQQQWQPRPVRPAAKRRVGVLGLGSLGQAVLGQLRGLGFDCAAWSRSRRQVDGVRCHAGIDELPGFLTGTDILVCLLPLTADTRGFLDAQLFAALPPGACLVHVGRGPQLVEQALLDALASDHLAHAVLDVCEPEPLPAGHPLWSHPKVWLTPHIASMTQPETAALAVIENLRRFAAGQPLSGLVDRRLGY